MAESKFHIIDRALHRLNSVAIAATDDPDSPQGLAMRVGMLGFSNTKDIRGHRPVQKNPIEVTRSKLYRAFGVRIVTTEEITNLCKKYQLTTNTASAFVDTIPKENQQDIINFEQMITDKKLWQGTTERDHYFIPSTNEEVPHTQYLVTAPIETFDPNYDYQFLSTYQLEMMINDDPIVWKRIWKFNPHRRDRKDTVTDFFALVTAWGLEAAYVSIN